MKKTLVSVGACAGAIVAISSAWGVVDRMIEAQRPWAKREVELVIIDLQAEARERECKKLEDRRYEIRRDLDRNPRSEYLREELKRVERAIIIFQSKVPHCGK